MYKKSTTRIIQSLIVWAVLITPLSIQTLFAFEMPEKVAGSSEAIKNKMFSPKSITSYDIVIDDLVMFEGRSSSSSCTLGSPQIKNSDDSLNVIVQNGGSWAADFSKGNSLLNVKLGYDALSDILSFRKTLSSGLTYIVSSDNSTITFYQNRKPFIIIDNIQNCTVNACFTVHFMMNRTTFNLYECTTTTTVNNVIATNNQNKPLASINDQHKMVISDGTASINTVNFNKATHTVSTHQVAPNPTNSTTTIKYFLSADASIRVSIYNALGQQIEVLVNQNQTKGEQNIEWKAAEILRGVYFYEIIANNERMVGKIIKQ